MEEILAYYLVVFAKPISQMTIVDLVSIAALPIAGIIGLAAIFSALGKIVDLYEYHFVWGKFGKKDPESKNP